MQIRDAEDGGRLDKRIPEGDRVAEGQEEGKEGQEPGRRRVDVEGAGGPGEVLGGADRAEPAEARGRAQRLGGRVLPLPDALHGRSAVAARHERGQMRLHDPNGECIYRVLYVLRLDGCSLTYRLGKNSSGRARPLQPSSSSLSFCFFLQCSGSLSAHAGPLPFECVLPVWCAVTGGGLLRIQWRCELFPGTEGG